MSRRAFSSSEGVLARWMPISHWLRRYTREDFGGDLIAGHRTHRFGRVTDLARAGLPAIFGDAGEDPPRIAGKDSHEIEKMRS